MKLISLNTWGGKIYNPLKKFIKDNSQNTDVFCFQEIFDTQSGFKEKSRFRVNLYQELSKILKNHNGFFVSSVDNYMAGSFHRGHFRKTFTNFDLKSGLAIFIKKNLQIKSQGHFFIFGQRNGFDITDDNSMPRIAQYITLEVNGSQLTILNVHGIWVREGKKDTPARLKQSKIINSFLEKASGKKIVSGDFNLDIKSESIRQMEEDMINLIKDYNIPATRNKFYPGLQQNKFADYTFVSNNIKVLDFQVPLVEISDHLPMILEFN